MLLFRGAIRVEDGAGDDKVHDKEDREGEIEGEKDEDFDRFLKILLAGRHWRWNKDMIRGK